MSSSSSSSSYHQPPAPPQRPSRGGGSLRPPPLAGPNVALARELQSRIKQALDQLDDFEQHVGPLANLQEEGEEEAEEGTTAGTLFEQEDLKAQLDARMVELAQLKARLTDAKRKKTLIDSKDAALDMMYRIRQTVEDAWEARGKEERGRLGDTTTTG